MQFLKGEAEDVLGDFKKDRDSSIPGLGEGRVGRRRTKINPTPPSSCVYVSRRNETLLLPFFENGE